MDGWFYGFDCCCKALVAGDIAEALPDNAAIEADCGMLVGVEGKPHCGHLINLYALSPISLLTDVMYSV